jgi:hypothetical protein
MPQATNPPTLNRNINININIKTDFAENNAKMPQATNPLILNCKFAENDVSFGSESASGCRNVKKEKSEDEAEENVFDVKEKRKPEKTKDCDCVMLDKPDIKIEIKSKSNAIIKLLQKRRASLSKLFQNYPNYQDTVLLPVLLTLMNLVHPDSNNKSDENTDIIELLEERRALLKILLENQIDYRFKITIDKSNHFQT